MAELAGLTKEEKIELFKKKQKQFRKEIEQVERRNQIDREKKRRENVKMAAVAKQERQERQMAMLAAKKKRELASGVKRNLWCNKILKGPHVIEFY